MSDNNNDGCNGCNGCNPPTDDTKRKKEKKSKHVDWVCSFCGNGKKANNRILNFGDSRPEGYCICSDCVEQHLTAFYDGDVVLARNDHVCSFCLKGKPEEMDVFSFKSKFHGHLYVCDECIVEQKYKMDSSSLERKQRMMKKILSPQTVYGILNDYIIGQEAAKRATAVQVYLQELKTALNKTKPDSDDRLKRSNILLIGPTGCGKTLIAETLRNKLNKVVVIADANTLSEAGYVGEDVSGIFTLAYVQAEGNLEKAQNSIIYIDEVDKIATKPGDQGDVSREPVQQGLLSALQGTNISIPKGLDKKSANDKVQFDTSNVLFIAAGAFSGLAEIIQKRARKDIVSLGFMGDVRKSEYTAEEILRFVERDDLIKFGLVPEFLGRFHTIVVLDALTIDTYLRILKEPKDSLVWHWTKIFSSLDKKLIIDDDALEVIAQRAKETISGARALQGIFEELMEETIFNMEEDSTDVAGYHLTIKAVKTGQLEKVYEKSCSGECGDNCCQLTGGDCCGGEGHDEEDDDEIKSASR